MRSSFFGLNIAVRGLYTAQSALNTVNHNLNNATTPGYSRQVAKQAASTPMPIYDGTGMIGTGAEITSVERVRDEYLDFKYWTEQISFGEWVSKNEVLSDIEATFNEPSDSGFSSIISDFFFSLQELSKDPGSPAVRALVRQRGISMTKYFNATAARFQKLQSDVNYKIKTKTEEVNSLALQITELNRQIYSAEVDGSNANDLRDRRTLLIDQMSKIINIDANEVVYGTLPTGEPDKRLSITISGKAIVDHFFKSDLKLTQRDETENINEVDIDELYEISWADGNDLTVRGGELKGLLDVRDGNEGDTGPNGLEAPLYKGIPFYMKKMNEFVRTFAMAFNEGYIDRDEDGTIGAGEDGIGHADSFDTAGNTGTRFFTFMDEDGNEVDTTTFLDGAVTTAQIVARYDDLTAANFSLSEELKNDYTMLATGDTSGEIGNTVNLNELLKLRHDVDMFAEGGAEDFMKALVATLGIDSQQAGRYYDNQHAITFHINNRRQSESGVSIDEEMSNLVKFQHAYNASAKMIQTMSELFDTLINRLY